jgi:hypothetical protein
VDYGDGDTDEVLIELLVGIQGCAVIFPSKASLASDCWG